VVDDRAHRLHGRLPAEGASRGKQLVEDCAEGEDVRSVIGRLCPRLLGGHVARGPQDDPRLRVGGRSHDVGEEVRPPFRSRLGPHELGQPEVEDLDPPVPGHEHVFRLEVAVHDSLLVGGGEPVGDLDRVVHRLAHWQGGRPQPLAKSAALQ
jgi:hypothetical protein